MLIAMVSGKGAPGTTVTAAALAAVWPRRPVLLVEADPRGGALLFGVGQGAVADGRGLLGLQLAARRGALASGLMDQVIELDLFPGMWLLPGTDTSAQAANLPWPELAGFLAGLDDKYDVIADCGAVPGARMPSPVWSAADLTVLVTRSTMSSAHFTEDAAGVLRNELRTSGLGADRLVSVVVGPGRPYPVQDLTAFLADTAPVEGVVSWDPEAAAVFADGTPMARPRRFPRTPLLKSATELAERLGARAQQLRAAQPAAVVDQPPAPPALVSEPLAPVSASPQVSVPSAAPTVASQAPREQVWQELARTVPQATPVPAGPIRTRQYTRGTS